MGITAGICENGCCGAATSDYRQSVAAGINRGVVFQPCRDITTASRLVSRDCDAGSRRHLEERQLRPRPSDWRTACRQTCFFDTHDADTSALVAAQNMEVRRVLADRERYVAPA